MKFYYDSESDKIISISDLEKDYNEFGISQGYTSLGEYIECCMYWNNGTLSPIRHHISALYDRIRRLHNTLGEYASEEITSLEAEIAQLKTLKGE